MVYCTDKDCECGRALEVSADTERKIASRIACLVEENDLEEHVAECLKLYVEWLMGMKYEKYARIDFHVKEIRKRRVKDLPRRPRTASELRWRIDNAIFYACQAMSWMKKVPENEEAWHTLDQIVRKLAKDEYDEIKQDIPQWKVAQNQEK